MPTDGVELASLVMGADVPWASEIKKVWDVLSENFETKEHKARGPHVHIKSVAVRKTVKIKNCHEFKWVFNQLISVSERPFFSSRLADTPVNFIYTLATATPEANEGLSLDFLPSRRYP